MNILWFESFTKNECFFISSSNSFNVPFVNLHYNFFSISSSLFFFVILLVFNLICSSSPSLAYSSLSLFTPSLSVGGNSSTNLEALNQIEKFMIHWSYDWYYILRGYLIDIHYYLFVLWLRLSPLSRSLDFLGLGNLCFSNNLFSFFICITCIFFYTPFYLLFYFNM